MGSLSQDYEDQEFKIKGRDKKLEKKKNRMRVNSRGLKNVILPILDKKSKPKSDFKGRRVTDRLIKSYQFEY